MNFLDILIAVPIGYAAWKGFKHGFIIELFTLLAILVGIYVGIHFSDAVALWMKKSFEWDSPYLPVIAFTITFLGVGAMIYFGGKVLEKMVKVVNLSPVNKAFGIVFAVLKMLYILSVLIVLIESYDDKGGFFPEKTKEKSLLYQPVRDISLRTVPALSESTIFIKNALQPEADSTGLTVDQVLRAKKVADSLGIDANDARQIMEVHRKYGEK
jgi:membrane protein required for colicin V production